MSGEIARSLIRSAARRAPEPLSERLEEEWLADLRAQRGSLSGLRFAFGCCWAARVIAHENSDPALPAAPFVSTDHKRAHFIRFPQEGPPVLMSGTITFVLVVSVNAAVLYGLILGLTHS